VAEWVDHGLAARLRELDLASKLIASVGYTGETAKIAGVLEYGDDRIPARPFMSRAVESSAVKVAAAAVLRELTSGRTTAAQATTRLGDAARAAVQVSIAQAGQWAAPNADGGQPLRDDMNRLVTDLRVEIKRG